MWAQLWPSGVIRALADSKAASWSHSSSWRCPETGLLAARVMLEENKTAILAEGTIKGKPEVSTSLQHMLRAEERGAKSKRL